MRIFLDSGAFSAKNKGTPIDLSAYIDYIHSKKHLLNMYANLDVIGDAEQSWRNQEWMEAAGLKPLPVHHMEDPPEFLDRALQYSSFCLGGMAGESPQRREYFFDSCWERICNTENRHPAAIVHGFGMTSPRWLTKYPWATVDSTSWVAFSKYGSVLVPRFKRNREGHIKKVFDSHPNVIFVSQRSPSKHDPTGRHIDQLTSLEKALVLQYFDSMGFVVGESKFVENEKGKMKEKVKVAGLANNLHMRDQLNLLYYAQLARTCKFPRVFEKSMKGMFDTLEGTCDDFFYESLKFKSTYHMGIYYAGNFPQMSKLDLERSMRDKVTGLGFEYDRLISFFYSKEAETVLKLKEEENEERSK